MRKPTVEQFQGCLVGCAVGDAVGAPVETQGLKACSTYIKERVVPRNFEGVKRTQKWAKPTPFGQYTDDTQFTREMVLAINEDGVLDFKAYAERLANLFREGKDVGTGRSTREAIGRLIKGTPWEECGTPPPAAGNGSAMRAAPVGLMLWHLDSRRSDSASLIHYASNQGTITHANVVCSAGAVAIAAAVREALTAAPPTSARWWRHVSVAVSKVSPDPDVQAFSDLILELWNARDSGHEFVRDWLMLLTPKFGREWRGISSWVVSSVLWSLYAFMTSPEDYWKTIQTALWPGGDVDSTAAMAGAISGAYNGLQAVPRDVAEQVHDGGEYGFEELCDIAAEMHSRVVEKQDG